ncbi:MAG TPA: hypothetical protein EYO58_10890 [Flavobacteriales bacterium]|nr:hypothetical protein [Flavobacteriales bacterium]
MREHKKPWLDVPIEVLIEEERRKHLEKQERERPRIYIPPPSLTPPSYEEQPRKEDENLIDFSLK